MKTKDLKYQNESPITDLGEALILLLPERQSLKRLHSAQGQTPYIESALHNSGYTGELYTSSEYWLVATELVHELLRMGFVAGTPHFGYTDQSELRLTGYGDKYGRNSEKERTQLLRTEIEERLSKSPLSADICLEINKLFSSSSLRYLTTKKLELDAIDLTADADAYKDFIPRYISRT